MARISNPIDAQATKRKLRRYALGIPLASLIGGWCTLLQIAWFLSPEGVVDHIPEAVRILAFFVAIAWLYGLYHVFRRLPGVIDDILDRGLMMTPNCWTARAKSTKHSNFGL